MSDRSNDIPVMTEEEYLTVNGASMLGMGDSALHKNRGKSERAWLRILEHQHQKDVELMQKRELLRIEYAQKVANGEIRPPSRIETLIQTANGHEDHESTWAARRILERRGIDWKLKSENDNFVASNNIKMQDNNAHDGKLAEGPTHAQGGIQTIIDGNRPLEIENGEVIINAQTIADEQQYVCTGTPKDITSKLNELKPAGVSWSEEGSCNPVQNSLAENGKKITSMSSQQQYQIKSPQGYFSVSMETHDPKFTDNVELGYTYFFDEANQIKDQLEKKGLSNLEVVPYVKYSNGVALESNFQTNIPSAKIYKVSSLIDTEYPVWTGTQADIISYIDELKQDFNYDPAATWMDNMAKMGLDCVEQINDESMKASHGTIIRSTDYHLRPSPAISATVYPEGYQMVGNDGMMWEISVASNGVHRWTRVKAEDGMDVGAKPGMRYFSISGGDADSTQVNEISPEDVEKERAISKQYETSYIKEVPENEVESHSILTGKGFKNGPHVKKNIAEDGEEVVGEVENIENDDFIFAKNFNERKYFTLGPDDGEKPLYNDDEVTLLKEGFKIEVELLAARHSEEDMNLHLDHIRIKNPEAKLVFSDNEFGAYWRIYIKKENSTASDGKWIKGAIHHPGALREKARRRGLIHGDEKLSEADFKKLERINPETNRQVELARTLRSFHHAEDGTAISNEKNMEIAKMILEQLGGMSRLISMTGAYNFIAIENGIAFKIKNPPANYIKVVLNGKDLYDVEIGRIRGSKYDVVAQANGMGVENLKPFIEKEIGMYLTLFGDGGYAENGMDVDGNYEFELYAVPNLDYERSSHEGSVRIKAHKVKASSIQEVSDKVNNFVNANDLGSGNFYGTKLFLDGKEIGWVSYNGRIWDMQEKPMWIYPIFDDKSINIGMAKFMVKGENGINTEKKNDNQIEHPKNDLGGYDYSGEDVERAKQADLLTLPKHIEGTNCGNCIFIQIKDAQKGLGFCTHPKILLPVTARMCCAYWDNNEASRSWVKKAEHGMAIKDPTESTGHPSQEPEPTHTNVSGQKIVIFKKQVNPAITITVKTYPGGQITDIINPHNIRFPFVVGQVLNMSHRTWACTNGWLVNDEDPCGEKRLFGIKVSDIPPGHPLQTQYPEKFR